MIENLYGEVPTAEDAALWQEGLELTFPVAADVDGSFAPVWDPEGVLPMAYILDRDGVIIWREAGGTENGDEAGGLYTELVEHRDDGEDDDGIEVMSPGLAVSPPDCHCFRNYRHVTCFVDLGWTSGWRPHYSN